MESQSKQLSELKEKVDDLKKRIHMFKNKNAVLLTNLIVFVSEKKKHMDSVNNILEREIKFARFRNRYLERTDKQKLISEMERIAQKISQENTIPFAAFNEIFKDGHSAFLFATIR